MKLFVEERLLQCITICNAFLFENDMELNMKKSKRSVRLWHIDPTVAKVTSKYDSAVGTNNEENILFSIQMMG